MHDKEYNYINKDNKMNTLKTFSNFKYIVFMLMSFVFMDAGTIHVSSLDDNGTGTLRQAILDSTSDDTIVFDINGTILLSSSLPLITHSLTIEGTDMYHTIIDGGQQDWPHLKIYDVNVTIKNISLVRAGQLLSGLGGSISIESDISTVVIEDCNISHNMHGGSGGAISARGTMKIVRTIFENNIATGNGGAISLQPQTNEPNISLDIISSSFSNNKSLNSSGGAVYLDNSYDGQDVTVSDCNFTSNEAFYGGAILQNQGLNHGGLSIEKSRFIDNNASKSAGAVYASGAFTEIIDSNFTENRAGDEGGGAIRLTKNSSIERSIFFKNSAIDRGGAVYDSSFFDDIVVSTCQFVSNFSVNGYAGAIYSDAMSSILIADSTFKENNATLSGGAIYLSYSGDSLKYTITRSLFTDNFTEENGGAIALSNDFHGSKLTVSNTTFSKNKAKYDGGALYAAANQLSNYLAIRDNTFVRNEADTDMDGNGEGGALYYSGSFRMSIDNSILNHNSAATSPNCRGMFTTETANVITSVTGCDIDLVGSSAVIISEDPQLQPLGDNGGTTETYALTETSSAFDSGTCWAQLSVNKEDQRSILRPQGLGCDIGAFELEQAQSVPVSATNVEIVSSTYTSMLVRWQDNSNNENGFHVYQDNVLVRTTDVNVTEINITGLTPETEYSITVSSFNAVGDSEIVSGVIASTPSNDIDHDGVINESDNCPNTANADQSDIDTDGIGDVCDEDIDNDTIRNSSDNCPYASNFDQNDSDSDGMGDACDPFPYDEENDIDNDGVGADTDNCPSIANSDQSDIDSDGIGDVCDTDIDGDTVSNENDNCPYTSNFDQNDSDSDWMGDVCDPFPYDQENDIDNDGIGADTDNCPYVANSDQSDIDTDGIGDVCDTDMDGDTINNNIDNCIAIANTNQANRDRDPFGDVCDLCPYNAPLGDDLLQVPVFNGSLSIGSPFDVFYKNGLLYVTGQNDVVVFDTLLKSVKLSFGTYGSGNGEFNFPMGITVDKDENIYVADFYNNRVQKFDKNGVFTTSWGNDDNLSAPSGICIGQNDEVFVSDTAAERIQVFQDDGTFIRSLPIDNIDSNWVTNLNCDGKGVIYASTSFLSNGIIVKIEENGTILERWRGNGEILDEFTAPAGLALDQEQHLIVVDADISGEARILMMNTDGTPVNIWGNMDLEQPVGLDIDKRGSVWIAENNDYNSGIFEYIFKHQDSNNDGIGDNCLPLLKEPNSDFTDNNSNDLLWHEASSGAVRIMEMSGMIPEANISVVLSSNTNLIPKGIGDFNGDGKPDILVHNQNTGMARAWLMDGTTKTDNVALLDSSNTNLQIAGVGDFDGDGDNDIATFNGNSGALIVWVMDGTTKVRNEVVLTGANLNLVPRGAGDMDNDGIPDIVLRNNNSGAVRVWTMNSDFTRKGNLYVTGSSNTNLELRGVIDINGDGNNDILNYNTNSGTLRAWLMDGNMSILSNEIITQESDLDWSVRN